MKGSAGSLSILVAMEVNEGPTSAVFDYDASYI